MQKLLTPLSVALLVSMAVQVQPAGSSPADHALAAQANKHKAQAVPAALRRALITYYGAGHPHAAAQLNGSDFWIVYLERRGSCGSGGCRAKIWKKVGEDYQYLNSIAVGSLPIVQLPTSTNGMPDLGVTQLVNQKPFLIRIPFQGSSYSEVFSQKTIPAGRGLILIDAGMLKPLR